MIKKSSSLLICLFIALRSFAQVQSGPMVGYSEMREVLLWVQTKQAAKVKFMYWEQGNSTQKMSTEEVLTQKDKAFVAKLIADQVQPSKKYDYELWVDGKKMSFSYPLSFQSQTLWQWRTDPPAFKFAFGSCAFVNDAPYDRPSAYGGDYDIYTAIYQQKPDFMVWGGDNTYLREPDWNTRTGVLYRNTHTRSLPQLQPLLASTHNYAIWDDHDFGPNDSDRSFALKNMTSEAFRLFWGNPNYVFEGACTSTFEWGDAQFFMLDDRWFRSPNNRKDDRTYFGEEQLRWLMDALVGSKATFKFIVTGGQILNTAALFENYATYGEERALLLQKIAEANIPGVLFLTGDRHHTVLHRLNRFGTYPLYDFTVSPLTSGAGKPADAEKTTETYVAGTNVENKRNFGMFEISGPEKDRVLKVTIYDAKGSQQWQREIKASELK
ncbi:alkaline phosphatase [Runella sp. SP2]|uniref:alkaline phosphatase D family protein n=1 Tax=Runella sp. SP2 TaxID=2268026 RepID=UPI000F08169D|nr:alkaline phosphatase D family protein [Runella sp. SP2]AYQ31284.1 alkaline phosphatase family protein [Runella sp. SP2]